MAIDWERSWWLASGGATAAPQSRRPQLFLVCSLEPRLQAGLTITSAAVNEQRLSTFTLYSVSKISSELFFSGANMQLSYLVAAELKI